MLIEDRDHSRQVFFRVWQKDQRAMPLEPMELVIFSVIKQHPEYRKILDNEDKYQSMDFSSSTDGHNPFLHMGLHIALQEQINTNRPPGITSLYQSMLTKCNDEHQLQHQIIQCLEEALWHAQQKGRMPDEHSYMENLRKLLR